eukprot:784503-Rhodomonas_salina.1
MEQLEVDDCQGAHPPWCPGQHRVPENTARACLQGTCHSLSLSFFLPHLAPDEKQPQADGPMFFMRCAVTHTLGACGPGGATFAAGASQLPGALA